MASEEVSCGSDSEEAAGRGLEKGSSVSEYLSGFPAQA